jgi:heterogeneous nuclear ribonucleoprotein L
MAIVEMFDQMSAENCIRFLNNAPIGLSAKLQIYWTDQNLYPNSMQTFVLPDGSLSYNDYTESKNQRFLVPRPNYWIQPPSKIVRFYNAPPMMDKNQLTQILKYQKVYPKELIFLPSDQDTKTSRGVMEFNSVTQAIQAVMNVNNLIIQCHSKSSLYLKLCFSSTQTLDKNSLK